METLTITLPSKLKEEAKNLIDQGYYASFSDLVRSTLRLTIRDKTKYEVWAEEARGEYDRGEALVIRSPKAMEEYMKSLYEGED